MRTKNKKPVGHYPEVVATVLYEQTYMIQASILKLGPVAVSIIEDSILLWSSLTIKSPLFVWGSSAWYLSTKMKMSSHFRNFVGKSRISRHFVLIRRILKKKVDFRKKNARLKIGM